MLRELTKAKKDGYRIVYIDETMFTRKSIPSKEYCLPSQNMMVDQALINEPTLAMLSGISKEKGQETYMIFPFSVNIAKFKEYLTKLREENEGEKICIFMDNLSTHTSQKSKDAMKTLGFKYIYNVPYEPDYNPIEFVFSKIKQKFKCLRSQKFAGIINDGHEALIQKAVKSVRKQDIVNCVSHV